MSSGIIMAPAIGAAAVALPVIAIAAAGVAAVLIVRACGAATEAAGLAAARLGEELERAAAEQDVAHVRDKLWHLAASEVVRVNAGIRLLAERATNAGVDVRLPAALTVAGHDIAGIRDRVDEAQRVLGVARQRVEAAEAARERDRLAQRMPAPAVAERDPGEILALLQESLRQRREAGETERTGAQPVLEKILGSLDPDANAGDREEVLLAAAAVRAETTQEQIHTYELALRTLVQNVVNPRVARRRLAATWLEALEETVVAQEIRETTPRPPFLNAAARLRTVVRGDADLTDELRRDSRDALHWAQAAAHRRRLLDAVRECLSERSFEVGESFTIGHHDAGLRAGLASWRGEHSADFWIDQEGNLRGELVKDSQTARDEVERCARLNDEVDMLAGMLRERGFTIAGAATDPTHRPQYRFASTIDSHATVAQQQPAVKARMVGEQ